ncbi:hypothetical protein F5B22DRAFT_320926 [Xylaria bambusicola]|uniref:uncharacterized protein n=1 Tax=Xylaria bambusicola TaxID=326684 RepID=UPI002007C9FF|nr:uncharacterized protein F5B22DRAFT_320926 [Xylaria bambusicola]KAI0509647.1 hypothetical protein F5B22DRAFT_320926 [Xylaria bambusicola]
MAEPWENTELCEGYVSLKRPEIAAYPAAMIGRLRCQRPWHGKILLPSEVKEPREENPDYLESDDLDCLIILFRMLTGSNFSQANIKNVLVTCAMHDFGYDRHADYQVKGMLVSRLFPEYLHDKQILQSKLTFQNLFQHEAVRKLILAAPCFELKDRRLLLSDVNTPSSFDEMEICPREDLIDTQEVKWDGISTLEQAVSEQSFYCDPKAKNGTMIARRYCTLPLFIRVMFTPDKDHPRRFKDVQRFQLKTEYIQTTDDCSMKVVMSDIRYHLFMVVKLDPRNISPNSAEIRVYDIGGQMLVPRLESKIDHRDLVGEKLKPDSMWSVGDPSLNFMLFYKKWSPLPEERHRARYCLAEHRPLSPIRPGELPGREPSVPPEPESAKDNTIDGRYNHDAPPDPVTDRGDRQLTTATGRVTLSGSPASMIGVLQRLQLPPDEMIEVFIRDTPNERTPAGNQRSRNTRGNRNNAPTN